MEQLLSRDKSVQECKSARVRERGSAKALFVFVTFVTFVTFSLWAIGFNFDPKTGLSGRLLTPNGDGFNDVVIFRYSNPMDSQVVLKIFNISGALMTIRRSLAGDAQISWDGKDTADHTVRSGIYLYQIESEGEVFHGTIIVIR